jgi:adenylate cyclase
MADVMREPGFPPLQFAGRVGLHGGFGFPIQIEDTVLGVITFFSRDIRSPDESLLTMFTSIGGQIGQFIERLRAEAALKASEEKLNYLIRRFVPSAVVEQLTSDTKDVVQLGGARHIVSVLFADIRGYTSLTESLEPPALMDLLNSYFRIIGRVILKHGGTINQYAGDMIMATFNVPNPQPDHALRAVQAAQEAQAALREHHAHNANPKVAAQFGIGINTGAVVVGYVGFEERFDFATLGETTNLAFRLSSIAEGGQILIGDQTLREIQPTVQTRPLGPIKLKGRTEPFPVHEVEW